MPPRKRPVVIALMPNAGLGNCLFVWARAIIFARRNELPLYVFGWNRFHIGPYIRGERLKRYYGRYFVPYGLWSERISALIGFTTANKREVQTEPCLSEQQLDQNIRYFLFKEIPHWASMFTQINDYQDLLRAEIFSMLSVDVRQKIAHCEQPEIGVHVRMGDFRELEKSENFANAGGTRTPLNYFITVINRIREVNNADVPVTLFSDGFDHELTEILKLPSVKRAATNPAIVDLLTLSRSKIIVTSAHSTFGEWAGFLSASPVIRHAQHIHERIRRGYPSKSSFEGPIEDATDSALKL